MDLSLFDLISAIPIAILYPFFINKFGDVVCGSDEIIKNEEILDNTPVSILASGSDPDAYLAEQHYLSETYSHNRFFFRSRGLCEKGKPCVFVKDNPQIDILKNKISHDRKIFNNKKFFILLIVGIIGTIFSSLYLKKYKGVMLGINVGSLATMSYATYINWQNFNEISKLAVTGIGLLALIYSGFKYLEFKS